MKKTIFHIDVNSAFLSWSALKKLEEDPGAVDLRTIPSAVGGNVETRHGIITAKSIPAKKYGITTGEPVVKALQKCPQLVLVRSDFNTYRKYSRALMEILSGYTKYIEQASIDEAYLDVTELVKDRDEAYALAKEIKDTVREELGFTVNVGIAENKLLAKTASDFSKPDKIHTLYPEEVETKFHPMEIGEMHGCGHATAEKLTRMGIRTIGDAAHADPAMLKALLGDKAGGYIYRSANGLGSVNVHYEAEEAKGYSNETTTAEDITAVNFEKEAPPVMRGLAESVSRRMIRDGVYAKTIGAIIKTNTFRRRSRQKTLDNSVHDADTIYEVSLALLRSLMFESGGIYETESGIRLLGVSGTNLDHGEFRQVTFAEALQEMAAVRAAEEAAEKARKAEEEAAEKARKAEEEAAEKARKAEEEAAEKARKAAEEAAKKKEAAERKAASLEKMQEKITKKYGEGVLKKGFPGTKSGNAGDKKQ